MTARLFLGGPADGTWREVEDSVSEVSVLLPPEVSVVTAEPEPYDLVRERVEHYSKVRIADPATERLRVAFLWGRAPHSAADQLMYRYLLREWVNAAPDG